MDALEETMSAALEYLDSLLADDKAAQECAKRTGIYDRHPSVVRLLDSLPGHTVRIEVAAVEI